MRLVNTYYDVEMDIVENQITVLTVENSTAYADIVRDIWRQSNGEEGKFILSEGEREKNISKELECIINPFTLDCNNKKVITRLYQELKAQAEGIMQEKTVSLNSDILKYLEQLLTTLPYNLKFNCDLDITNLMKIYGVELENLFENLLESIVEYIKVLSQICNINTFVFVDIKHYLSKEEIKKFYEFAFYKKANIIIIEPVRTARCGKEKCWIIDKDLCIIEL